MARYYNPPYEIKAHSWDSIEELYVSLNNNGWKHERLLELVRYIKSSGLSERLFAYTSLDRLFIGKENPIESKRELLFIAFDRDKQKWHFKYLPKPFEEPEFVREYDADKGIEKLNSFIKLIKW